MSWLKQWRGNASVAEARKVKRRKSWRGRGILTKILRRRTQCKWWRGGWTYRFTYIYSKKNLDIARKGGWRGRRFQARKEVKGIPSLLRFRCASTSTKTRTLKRRTRARQRQLSSTLIPHNLPQATRAPRQCCLITILCLLFLFSPLPLILTGWDVSESCMVLISQEKSETIFDMMILIVSFLSSLPPVPIASTLIKANKVL